MVLMQSNIVPKFQDLIEVKIFLDYKSLQYEEIYAEVFVASKRYKSPKNGELLTPFVLIFSSVFEIYHCNKMLFV